MASNMAGRTMPLKDVHILILGPRNMLLVMQRGIKIAGGNKVANRLTLRWAMTLDYLGGWQSNHRGSCKREAGESERAEDAVLLFL